MPTDPIGRSVRNIFDLERVGRGLSVRARKRLAVLLDQYIVAIVRRDPTAVLPRFQQGRIDKILAEIGDLTDDAFAEILKDQRQELAELARQQADWARDQLKATLGVDALGQVKVQLSSKGLGINWGKALVDRDPIRGNLLADWFTKMSEDTKDQVRREINQGIRDNQTLDQIIRRVRGRSDGRGGFTGGVMKFKKARDASSIAESVVRTSVNDIANSAHMATYRQNDDVVKGVRFTATLDERTTDICIAHDGREWALDADNIARPPLHVRCRSVLTPIIDWKGLGLKPPPEGTRASSIVEIGPDGKVRRARDAKGRLRGKQVPARQVYEEWLREQSDAVQDEILGKSKAQLWRDGKIKSLRELVTRDRRVKTVKELAP